ncbi:MAG TPA: hypothetical protein VN523_11825 [Hyphomicrobiaceae bacterium]|jgi:hypothetical protein|nr:hypothetical protein [Hyphomicrobiaceae bacterium]
MVSDASSGDGRRAELERDRAPVKGSDGHARSTADLTHELAQLLAATIAQRQLTSGLPATSPPPLNLAGLSSQQRILEPTFKDGLSALSYKAPRGTSLVPSMDFSADDEPMPIPSTWREPAQSDDRWLRQQMGATLLGLCAGLLVVVPIVLWLSGWLGEAQKSRPQRSAEPTLTPIEPRAGEVKTVKVQVRPVERTPQTAAQYVTGSIDGRAAAEPPRLEPIAAVPVARAPEPATRPEPARQVDDRLAEARHRIESGDVSGARDILSAAEGNAPGPISFALAETYDPNMLAAWGTRGAIADVARAKALYHKSLGLGMARAQARLEALQ